MSAVTPAPHLTGSGSDTGINHQLTFDVTVPRFDNVSINGGFAHLGDNHYYFKEPQLDHESHQIQGWKNTLLSLDSDVKHEAAHDQCTPGTGQWFLDSDPVKLWLSGDEKVIWCPGNLGAGKTCMASIVIQHLKKIYDEHPRYATAYVYFDYLNRDEYTPRALLADLLGQTLQTNASLSRELFEKCKELDKIRTNLTKGDFLSLLRSAAKAHERVFIVIDALDEVPDRQRKLFISSLRNIGNEVSLLVTSRPIGTITELFHDVIKQEIYPTENGIAIHVRNQIADDSGLSRRIGENPTLEQDIVAAVAESAQHL